MKRFLVIAEQGRQPQVALEKAMSLAKLTSASIHVVINCYQEMSWLSEDEYDGQYGNAKVRLTSQEESWWRDYIDSVRDNLVISHQVVWHKYLADWVLKHCRNHPYDLIFKRGHRSESVLYTPSDWLLLRDSKVPVYIASEEHQTETPTVLVALDLLAKSPEKCALNEKLLETAFRIAVATNSDLHCCYVIKVLPIIKDMEMIDIAAHEKRLKKLAGERWKELFQRYDLDKAHVHIKTGVPWKVIASLASELKVNCVVIGTMGRKGLAGKFFGNTSEKVIHVAHKDLLVIGPD